jgi:adenosylhomocysteinase
MANLTAGQGDSLNAFDVTLATMVAGIGFMVREGQGYEPGLHILPRAAWLPVASRAVALGQADQGAAT